MPYDSIVCVKQVPDTANITAEAMKEDGTVNRAALPAILALFSARPRMSPFRLKNMSSQRVRSINTREQVIMVWQGERPAVRSASSIRG